MRQINRLVALLFLASVLFPVRQAFADGQTPQGNTGDTSSVWSEVFQPDGSLQPTLQDMGVVTQQVDWVPDLGVLGLNGEAEYHVYVTPSGNTVAMPTATTLFFMAANADKSGFNDASGYVMNGAGSQIRTAGMVTSNPKQAFAQMAQSLGLWDEVKDKYTSPDEFADAVISGKETWSWGLGDIKNMLSTLLKNSKGDKALYTAFLLYTPDSCKLSPVGCPAPVNDDDNPPPAPPSECAPPSIHKGKISGTARLVAPPFPLVVGQDPDKRGADLEFTLTIQPTIYTWYEQHTYQECRPAPAGDGRGCPASLSGNSGTVGNPYYTVVVWTDCTPHKITLPERANWVKAVASLTPKSREWITRGSLGIRYPGAYLHHPDWSWFNLGTGGFDGPVYTWRYLAERVQVADPGEYTLTLDGYTSGTEVAAGRSFHLVVGSFEVAVFTSTLKH